MPEEALEKSRVHTALCYLGGLGVFGSGWLSFSPQGRDQVSSVEIRRILSLFNGDGLVLPRRQREIQHCLMMYMYSVHALHYRYS